MCFFCIICCAFWLSFVCVDAHSWTQPSEATLSSSPAMQSTPTERVEASSNSLCKVCLPRTAHVSRASLIYWNISSDTIPVCGRMLQNQMSIRDLTMFLSVTHRTTRSPWTGSEGGEGQEHEPALDPEVRWKQHHHQLRHRVQEQVRWVASI